MSQSISFRPSVRLFLLEDKVSMMRMLLHGFKMCIRVEYEVTSAKGLGDCVQLSESLERGFDVWILDLLLDDCDGEIPGGFLPLLCQMMEPPPMSTARLRIIYTASQRPEDHALALKCNATHFISKAEVAPHQLVNIVTDEILAQLRRAKESEMVTEFFSENFVHLVEKYGGQHVAVCFEDARPVVASAAPTRLEALVAWYKSRTGRTRPKEPLSPHSLDSLPFVLYVPKDGV